MSQLTLTDGTQIWYKAGRTNGCVIVRPDGEEAWFNRGTLHRIHGPAIIWADGTKQWWVNGEQVDPLVMFVLKGNKG